MGRGEADDAAEKLSRREKEGYVENNVKKNELDEARVEQPEEGRTSEQIDHEHESWNDGRIGEEEKRMKSESGRYSQQKVIFAAAAAAGVFLSWTLLQ